MGHDLRFPIDVFRATDQAIILEILFLDKKAKALFWLSP